MIDDKKTQTNFNQTMHDLNTLNKNSANFDINTKVKEFSNSAGLNNKNENNVMSSGDKTIEM